MPIIETKWILGCAKYFFTQYVDEATKLGDDIYLSEKVKYLLFAFISASRCVTFYMENEFNYIAGFLEWYKIEVKKLDDRWVDIRNITQKEHSPRIGGTVIFNITLPPESNLTGNKENQARMEIVQEFVTLYELGSRKSIEEECAAYLASLETLVDTCIKEFGNPHEKEKISQDPIS